MTRKDYIAIASLIRARIDEHKNYTDEVKTAKQIAWDLAGYFAAENSRFDRAKFLDAANA